MLEIKQQAPSLRRAAQISYDSCRRKKSGKKSPIVIRTIDY